MRELLKRACLEDPFRGVWQVSQHGAAAVWTDASSIGLGVLLLLINNLFYVGKKKICT